MHKVGPDDWTITEADAGVALAVTDGAENSTFEMTQPSIAKLSFARYGSDSAEV
ncbi:hypothetical protein GCM10009552_15980 [Rothia nasimurium]